MVRQIKIFKKKYKIYDTILRHSGISNEELE